MTNNPTSDKTTAGVQPYSATIWGEGYIGGASFDDMMGAILYCRGHDSATRFVIYDLDDVAVHEEVRDAWRVVVNHGR